MKENKQGHGGNIPEDFSEDNAIIELTEEVPQNISENREAAAPENYKIASGGDPTFEMDEDLIIQSAIEEYLGDEGRPENNMGRPDGFDRHDEDDFVIMDGESNEMDDSPSGAMERDAIPLTGGAREPAPDDESEIAYKSDPGGFDFFAMAGDAEYEDEDIEMDDIRFESEEGEEIGIPTDSLKEPPEIEQRDKLLNMRDQRLSGPDEGKRMEPGDRMLSLDDLEDEKAGDEEEIVEITEFDQHFEDDSQIDMEQAVILNPSGLADEDFLELFESQGLDPTDAKKSTETDSSEEKPAAEELNRLFDDVMKDEDLFESGPQTPASHSDRRRHAPESSTKESKAGSSGLFPKYLRAGTGSALFPGDLPEESDNPENGPGPSNKDEFQLATPAQIEAAITRVIREKFAARIERIIYEIIEKAVSKEIERLKNALLEENPFQDDF